MDISDLPNHILDKLNIVVTDNNNIITFVSPHYAKLMGYAVDEMIGKTPGSFRYPESYTHLPWDWNVFFWEKLNSEKEWHGVLKNKKKNGDAVYVSQDIYKQFDESGNHLGFYSIISNITDTITKPHKFVFDNELTQTFLSNDELTALCLCESETNPTQKIVEISDKLAAMIGFDKEYFRKNTVSFTEVISSKSKYYKNLPSLVEDFMSDDESVVIELDDKISNTVKKFKLMITPFYYVENVTLARIFRLIDITKELEYTEKLNRVIETKNKFLANISHEIKTPLNAINGFLTLLESREENKEKLDYLNIILSNTHHILDLANDIIDLAGIDNNNVRIIPRQFTVKDLQTTIEIFFAKSAEKNIEFDTYISPQLPEVMEQDILRLKQIYTNLISNAIKFVDPGGLIKVDIHKYGSNLHFTIEDNGIGMTPEQRKTIFSPFTQATEDIKLYYGGTGLGLSVVKEIVKMMGGSITVESEIGKGTTFTVITPVKIIKDKKVEGKLNIDSVSICAPSFSINSFNTIKKYLMHFTNAKIQTIDKDDPCNIENSCLIINLSDYHYIEKIKERSKYNKIILIKKMTDIIHDFDDNPNVVEITVPVLGSKLYNALNGLYNDIITPKKSAGAFDFQISGKILVADDMESNRLLIKELLSKYQISLDLVPDGKDAIELFNKSIKHKKSSYDMIFLDMNMHMVDGFKASQHIREFEKEMDIERTPIIALTANRYDANDSRLINMDEYLPKPINLKHLLSTIIKYTSNRLPDTKDETDRILMLKEIRDCFMGGGTNLSHMIDKMSKYFSEEEKNFLNKLKQVNGNKREFNTIYNQIIKKVRQNY